MIPTFGGNNSKASQMMRIKVTSVPKYSAKPAQTPAIFLPARMRRSRLAGGTAATGTRLVGAPHDVQYRAVSPSCVPHRVQYIRLDYPAYFTRAGPYLAGLNWPGPYLAGLIYPAPD